MLTLPQLSSQLGNADVDDKAGMNYLHECDILHLDLKPENVLLSAAGIVRICDFGAFTITTGCTTGTLWHAKCHLFLFLFSLVAGLSVARRHRPKSPRHNIDERVKPLELTSIIRAEPEEKENDAVIASSHHYGTKEYMPPEICKLLSIVSLEDLR